MPFSRFAVVEEPVRPANGESAMVMVGHSTDW